MNRKSISIPVGMLIRSFYCHQCGHKLQRQGETRIVHPGDADYKKYAVQRTGNRTTFWLGDDVEVTEYVFHCPNCNVTIVFDDQLIIEYIQKKTGNRCLTKSEVSTHEVQGKNSVERNKRLFRMLWYAVTLALTAIVYFISTQTS